MAKLSLAVALATGASGAAGYGALSYFAPDSAEAGKQVVESLFSPVSAAADETVSLTVTERPGYPVSRFEAPPGAGPIICAIGLYEGGSRHDFNHSPRETVQIEIGDQHGQPLYLALSSYEPVLWVLGGPGAGDVRGVYLAGYNRHEVAGVAPAIVANKSGLDEMRRDQERARALEDGGWGAQIIPERVSCTITYAEPDGGGCDAATGLLRNAQDLFKAPVGSFFGIYNAQGFRIGERSVAEATLPSERSRPNPWSIGTNH